MGIYDRDYYRSDGPSFFNQGQVCKFLILLNVIVFFLQLVTYPQRGAYLTLQQEGGIVTEWLDLQPARVMHGEVWRLLTYAFLHSVGSIWHIVFNMLLLWWFGKDMEDLYGPREFLFFYLVAAALGGVAFTVDWIVDPEGTRSCIGASGAVTAVLVLCAFHYPYRRILIFYLLPVPLWLMVVVVVGIDFQTMMVIGHRADTAVVVHLAGAAFAALYYKLNWRLSSWGDDFLRWWRTQRRRRVQPRLRV